jgi:nicastrin
MLAAKLDSTSMFDGEVTGAGSTIAGLVSVLATARMLAAIRPEMEPLSKGRNVMIALLNGESHDYIGSGRLVFDMKQHK